MDDQSKLKKTESVVVVYNTCGERCCFKRYRLSEEELEALNVLRSRCRIPFNKENLVHNDLLKQLWRMSYPELDLPAELKTDKWKELGFQGKDPATDFRGAGLFGLEQLIYLASNYPQEYNAMKQSAKSYSFAISALNITVKCIQHLLMCYFQLHKSIAVGIPGGKTLGIKQLQVFCKLNSTNMDTINELYVAAVIKMHDTWTEMNKVKKVNLMQFQGAIVVAGEFIVSLLEKNPADLLELKKLAFA